MGEGGGMGINKTKMITYNFFEFFFIFVSPFSFYFSSFLVDII